MTISRPGPVLRRVLHVPVTLYRAGLGRLFGRRFLMLTHVGRRSGRRYDTVVEVVGELPETGEYVVMSGFGPSADWYRNVRAGGARQVVVGRDRFIPAVREVGPEEGAAVLGEYERHHRLLAPFVRAVLSRLVGRPYGGTPEDRRALVCELPMVAFRPSDVGAVRPDS